MTKNEIVGRLKYGGLDASSINRSAAVYVTDAIERRAKAGWFAFRIVCDSEETERRARAILSRWYDIDASGDVWRLKSKNRIPLMAIKRGAAPSVNGYMYLEAAQANSTVSMLSNLEPAPDLEYSTDGVTWNEWQHTTVDGNHAFDTITLGAVGDKVYFRGEIDSKPTKSQGARATILRTCEIGKAPDGENAGAIACSPPEWRHATATKHTAMPVAKATARTICTVDESPRRRHIAQAAASATPESSISPR